MKVIITAAALALLAPLAALAEGDVTPGLWAYDASAALGPVPMRETGTHCVDPEMAAASYERLLNGINPDCRVTGGAYRENGYDFTLRCTGAPKGELEGRLEVDDEEATLNARGWTGTPGSNVPVILSASAKKLAPNCS